MYSVLFCITPESGSVSVEDINASGAVAGTYISGQDYYERAFRWNGAKTTVPNPPGACETHAFGINDSGAVVGSSSTCYGGPPIRAFYWNGTTSNSISL